MRAGTADRRTAPSLLSGWRRRSSLGRALSPLARSGGYEIQLQQAAGAVG
jgi:hypothetical protein